MKTKVIFKKISWFDEPNPIVEINAIFPEEIESKVNGETLYMGYAHIGQHTAIHEDFLNKNEVGVHKVENASYIMWPRIPHTLGFLERGVIGKIKLIIN